MMQCSAIDTQSAIGHDGALHLMAGYTRIPVSHLSLVRLGQMSYQFPPQKSVGNLPQSEFGPSLASTQCVYRIENE
jgi:hypothetical protein